MKWEDAYDIVPSKNIRGENVYDVFIKGTQNMIWADIPVEKINEFLGGLVYISEKVIEEEMDKIFSPIDKSSIQEHESPITTSDETTPLNANKKESD